MKKIVTKVVGTYLNALSFVAPEKAGKQAFRIFCYPFRTPFKPHHKSFLNSSEKFEFLYRDISVQGYKWGTGKKKILFLHGWQSHSFRWKNYVESLPKDKFTIYSIDAPGHGASQGNILHVPMYSELVQQFIDQTGEFDTIIGHSMGGFSILHAKYHNPDLPVQKLIIMGAPGEGEDFVDYFQNTLKLSQKTINLTLRHFQNKIGKPLNYFSTSRFAQSINVPGLIIHDKNDKEAPYKYAAQIKSVWQNSELVTTEGLNHNLKSPKVVEAVKDFILKTEQFEIKETTI